MPERPDVAPLPPLPRRRRFDDAQAAELARLYAEGWSCRRLAEAYGTTDRTVWKTLRRLGVEMRPRHRHARAAQ